ncbi:MAG TPA: hypothetical protein VKA63_06460 [Candidatus Krumholzibacteria bacterium]|nr:hypothetical protein [Candidatus Krumholzibacteria bacterium]
MNRQFSIRKEGEHYHLTFHNYQGPAEGKRIADWLGLEATDPPSEEAHEQAPGLNQYFLWQPMSFHPDLQALVEKEKLPKVAQLVKRMRATIMEGKELLPDLSSMPGTPAAKVGAAAPVPEHHSLTEEMEQLHERVWHRGPKAVVQALVIRAVPTLILVLAAILMYRHMGDHYTEMSLEDALRQANEPIVSQSALGKFWNPDYSHHIRVPITSANFTGGSRVICEEGDVLHFEGVADIRAILKRAADYTGLPRVDALAHEGVLEIHRLTAGGNALLSSGVLTRESRLPRSAEKPKRVSPGITDGFQNYEMLDPEDEIGLNALSGVRISLEGLVKKEDAGMTLRFKNGAGVVLHPRQEGTACDHLLHLFVDDPNTIQVDGVLSRVYLLVDREDPLHSRRSTRLVGDFAVYSASAQRYHAVDQR